MGIANYQGVFPATEMRMAGIYASFQSGYTLGEEAPNVFASRRVKSVSKDGENYDQEEVLNIAELNRFKNFMACQGDPGTLTLEMYYDTRKNPIHPPSDDMTTSYAGVGQGTVYLAHVTHNGTNWVTSVFFECKANIQSANSMTGESGKPMGMTVVLKLTGTPTYYTIGSPSVAPSHIVTSQTDPGITITPAE